MAPPARFIRVLIIADDADLRASLAAALASPGFVVVAQVGDADAACRSCEDLQPDICVVDAGMPLDEGFVAVQDIMAFRPTPILVLTDSTENQAAFDALALGALDVMVRPSRPGVDEGFRKDLCARLRLLSGVRVITHVRGRRQRKRPNEVLTDGPPVIGIAASLGGPRALAVLLKGLPIDLKAPIIIVQHISQGFAQGLAAWLQSESGLLVKEAEEGELLTPGKVLVAPSGFHLTVGPDEDVVLDDGPAFDGFKPSATVMFSALARRYAARAIGVVLTGMGRDGAEGLAAIRAAGGRTLAQDEATSVVYGMPRAAVEAGAVEKVLPLEELPEAVASCVRQLDASWKGGR